MRHEEMRRVGYRDVDRNIVMMSISGYNRGVEREGEVAEYMSMNNEDMSMGVMNGNKHGRMRGEGVHEKWVQWLEREMGLWA